jgi:hypothetical protein
VRALGINNNEQVLIWCGDGSGGGTSFVFDLAHPSEPAAGVDCGGQYTMAGGINDSAEVVVVCPSSVDEGGFIAWPQ